jgi:hypothetical protein
MNPDDIIGYTYFAGIFVSYIYWGINHGQEPKKTIKIKHILLGWFNHIIYNNNDVTNSCITLLWPLVILYYICLGIGWVIYKVAVFTRLSVLLSGIVNLRIKG